MPVALVHLLEYIEITLKEMRNRKNLLRIGTCVAKNGLCLHFSQLIIHVLVVTEPPIGGLICRSLDSPSALMEGAKLEVMMSMNPLPPPPDNQGILGRENDFQECFRRFQRTSCPADVILPLDTRNLTSTWSLETSAIFPECASTPGWP